MRSDQTPSGSNRRAFFFVQILFAGFTGSMFKPTLMAAQINHSFRRGAASECCLFPWQYRLRDAWRRSLAHIPARAQFRHKKHTKETES
ncbi:hypothetical protein [Rhizobium sp. Root483D2]|uniref:hypothetical protein n=1 Tax=Rhizobium sp. Root483D2 TaxID=1736545 RepID=UPI000AA8E0CD|nr:hypothetical protein [Rhizobium sp. Root483D2]